VPLYEFECKKCHHRFEKIQSVSAPDPKCPKCKSKVERLLHAPAIQFKGSGWYATDYAKKSASGGKSETTAGDKADASAAGKTESSSESKSAESKPAGAKPAAPGSKPSNE
jgi:putative FmdB family regulatory protein